MVSSGQLPWWATAKPGELTAEAQRRAEEMSRTREGRLVKAPWNVDIV